MQIPLAKAMEIAPDADFAVHTGDFVEIAQVEDEWVDNLDMSRDANMNLPHAYTPGNHDEYNLNYIRDFKNKDLTAFNEHTRTYLSPTVTSTVALLLLRPLRHPLRCSEDTNDNKVSGNNPDGGAIGRDADGVGKERHRSNS